jgi:hypothetical protein
MTVFCHGECHVWLGSSKLCTCQVEKAAQLIGNYYPYFPPRPPTPPTLRPGPSTSSGGSSGQAAGTKDSATDVPLQQFKAAQAVNATHLSADGKRAYDERQSSVWYCEWDDDEKKFSVWWRLFEGLPADAVKIE